MIDAQVGNAAPGRSSKALPSFGACTFVARFWPVTLIGHRSCFTTPCCVRKPCRWYRNIQLGGLLAHASIQCRSQSGGVVIDTSCDFWVPRVISSRRTQAESVHQNFQHQPSCCRTPGEKTTLPTNTTIIFEATVRSKSVDTFRGEGTSFQLVLLHAGAETPADVTNVKI